MTRISESFFTWRRHRVRIFVFWLAMMLSCFTVVVSVYVTELSATVKDNVLRQFELEVYLQPGISGAARDSALAVLKRSAPPGANFLYVSPLDAREKFAQEFGSDLLDLLGDNPLPASFVITFPPQYAQPFRIRQVQKLANQLDGVDDAVFEGEIASRVEKFFFDAHNYVLFGGGGIALLGLLLAFIALRSAVVDSSGIAYTMSLLGAPRSYFRAPYHQIGAVLGIAAGAVSLLAWLLMERMVIQFDRSFYVDFPLFLIGLLPAALVTGWLLGIASTRALKHLMRQR